MAFDRSARVRRTEDDAALLGGLLTSVIGFVLTHRADTALFFPNGQFQRLVESLEPRFILFLEGAKLLRDDCPDLLQYCNYSSFQFLMLVTHRRNLAFDHCVDVATSTDLVYLE